MKGEAMEEEEEEQNQEEEEEEDTGEDSIVAKAKAAASKKCWNKLPCAPKAVQDKVKSMAFRAGKREQRQELALAYAKGGWHDNVFKSMESLEEERSRGKEVKAIPRVLMGAKCGGEEAFNQAWE